MEEWDAHYRTIILEPDAQQFVDSALKQNPRFGDRWRSIEWLLARTPEAGAYRWPNASSEYWLKDFSEKRLAKTPNLVLLYSFTENDVRIYRVRFGPGSETR